MSNLNKKILLFVMFVGVAFGLVSCSNPDNSVRIYFSEDAYEVRMGETKVIEPTIIKSSQVGDIELVYTSSDESIVKVEDGVLVPVAMGEAVVKVAWADRDVIFDKATVKVVKAALPQPVLDYAEKMLKGAEQKVSVSLGNNLTEATYSFEALTPEVAEVSAEGVIKAVAVGTAKFKLTVADYEESETVEFEVAVEESDFAIKYELNGGTNHAENPVGYNALALPLPLKEATKEGYTFLGWYNSADEKVEAIPAGTLGDYAVTAKWQITEYTIAFSGLEGAELPAGYVAPTSYTVETADIELVQPTKAGYTFLGWYAGEQKLEKIAKGSTGNLELVAEWEAIEYSIKYTNDKGSLYKYSSVDEAIADYLVDYNAYAKKSHTIDTYKELGAWGEISTASLFLYSENYRAKWAWLVDYLAEYGSKANKPAYQAFNKYNSQSELNAANGNYIYEIAYELRGWVGQFQYTKNGNYVTSDYSDAALSAKAALYYGPKATYTVEEELVLPVIQKEGYTFLGWYNSADEKVEKIAKGSTGDVEFTAKWEIVKYTISYVPDGANVITSHEQIVAEFLKDFSVFSGTTITSAEQYWANGSKTNFWKNAEMHAKWSWIFKFLAPLAKAQGQSTQYLDNMNADPVSVSGYATQNVAIFLLKANATIWNEQYKALANGTGLSSKWTTVDCTGVKFEDYASYLPEQFPVLVGSYTVEDEITLAQVAKEGYIFLGWFNEAGEKVEKIAKGSTGDVKLTAQWKLIVKYTIEWNLAEGAWEGEAGATEFLEGEYAKVVLPTPVKKYHTFLGWFNEAGEKVEALTADQNYKLTAKWEDQRIDGGTQFILFDLTGGQWKDGQLPGVDVTDYVEVLKLIPVKTGYVFAEWVVESDNETDPVTIIYTATWKAAEAYTINYVLDGGENDAENPAKFDVTMLPLTLKPATKEGYIFDGWYDGETKVEVITEAKGELTLTAKWKEEPVGPFNISYDLAGGKWQIEKFTSHEEMKAAFLSDMLAYLQSLGQAIQTIDPNDQPNDPAHQTDFFGVSYAKRTEIPAFFLTHEVYSQKWKWMYDYVAEVSGKDISDATVLRSNIHAFVYQTIKKGWPESFDGTTVKFDDYKAKVSPFCGTELAGPTQYEYGTAVALPTPSHSLGEFLGWTLNGEDFAGITAETKGDLVLVAKWKIYE